jgi:hypothetical protein
MQQILRCTRSPVVPLSFFFCQTQVRVQILTGRQIHLTADPLYDTVLSIKEKIQTKEGIHPDQQLLLLHGLKLHMHDNVTLDELHFQDGACFFLVLRNRGG